MRENWGDRATRLKRLAFAVLIWERLWPLLWPLLAVLAAFLTLIFFDVLPRLPGWLHALVLLGFAGGLGWVGRNLYRGLSPIDEREVLHRIETDNALSHRPLIAVDDKLAAGSSDPAAVALWELHRRRMARLARNLIVRAPRPGVPRRDPYAVRAAVLIVFVVAAIVGYDDMRPRFIRAMLPQWGAPAKPISLDVWITPPAYTRMAPLFLDKAAQQAAQPLKLPKGSLLLAQVSGSRSVPGLRIGDAKSSFETIGPSDHRIETAIEGGDRLSVELGGRTLASWPLEIVVDQPPTIRFQRPPDVPSRSTQVRIDYQAGDDYGLATVVAEMRRVGDPKGDAAKPGIEVEMSLPALGAKEAKGRLTRDLTPHPWAGFPVKVRLVATDVGGLTAQTGDEEITLPEREFKNPISQVLIRHRKMLVEPTPEAIEKNRDALDRLLANPDLYSNDTTVFLGLKVSRTRLDGAPDEEEIATVQKMMWDLAIRLEEGQVDMAQRELSKLQEELRQAWKEQLSNPEIQKLMEELRRALDKYMEALAEQFRDMRPFEGPFPPNALDFNQELQKMLEQAQKMAEDGDREGAEQMMERLREMLEKMQEQIARNDPNSPAGRAAAQKRAQAQRAIHGLQQLTKKQVGLIDRVFRQDNKIDQPPRGLVAGVQEAIEQEEMRRTLGDLMLEFHEVFGGIPGNVGEAERGMRDSTESLITGLLGQSLKDQAGVLKELRKSSNDAQQQMAQQFGGMMMMGRLGPGQGPGWGPGRGDLPNRFPGGPRDGVERDPFGRENQEQQNAGDNVDGPVEIPDQMDVRQAQEILEELRRRSADRSRSAAELDYIERLLKQF